MCLAAVAAAAPQVIVGGDQFVGVLRDERQDLGGGAFSYTFETENGITETRTGNAGSEGQINMSGTFL